MRIWARLVAIILAVALVATTFVPVQFRLTDGNLLSISMRQVGADSPGWLSGWSYRKSHNITAAAGAGTNYQVPINVYSDDPPFAEVWDSGTLTTQTAADTARNIIIDGDYLYGVSNTGKQFVIYDVSTPSSPVQKAKITMTLGGIDVRKTGDYVFVSNSDGVVVMDVSDPEDPTEDNQISLGAYVHGMFLSGNYLYCTMHLSDKLQIVDITDPTDPDLKGSYTSSTYIDGAHDVYVDGSYAYVASYTSTSAGKYGLAILNVSNVDSISLTGYSAENTSNSYILKKGNYVYIGGHDAGNGLRIYDVSNPASPVAKSHSFGADYYAVGYWMDWWGDYLMATARNSAGTAGYFLTIDVSDPVAPVIVTATQVSTQATACVQVAKDLVWISCQDKSGSDYLWRIRAYDTVDSGANVGLGGKGKSDFSDLRITTDDGETLLNYWIEPIATGVARLWVKIEADLSTVNRTVYLYYGKSDATTTASGANTFIVFDDFERGNNGDAVGGSWTVSQGTAQISTEQKYHGTRSLKLVGHATLAMATLPVTASNSIAIRFRIYKPDATTALWAHGTGTNLLYAQADAAEKIYVYDGAWKHVGDIGKDMWQLLEHNDFVWASKTCDVWLNDARIKDNAALVTNTGYPNVLYLQGGAAGLDWWVDDVIVRKYVSPEPAHGAWGSEETYTMAITSTPDSYDFGTLAVNTTSTTGLDYFTITNTGGVAVDITIQGTDLTGGDDTWTLSDTAEAGANTYGLKAGLEGGDYTVIVKKSATYNTLKSNLAASGTQKWGLKLWMPTSVTDYDGQEMSGNVTLVASAAS